MGYSFKEILKEDEEVGNTIFSLGPVHLKLIGLAFKDGEMKTINKDQLEKTYMFFSNKALIKNGKILTKLLLTMFFNPIKILKTAVETKDTSKLYLGPFYVTELEYWGETIVKDYTTDYETCEQCAGTGEEESECWDCNGTGKVEGEEEGETENCVECDGSGTLETECNWCYGEGEETIESPFYELNQYSIQLFSKEKINSGFSGEISDFWRSQDNNTVLMGHLSRFNTETEFDKSSSLEPLIGRITSYRNTQIVGADDDWLGDII